MCVYGKMILWNCTLWWFPTGILWRGFIVLTGQEFWGDLEINVKFLFLLRVASVQNGLNVQLIAACVVFIAASAVEQGQVCCGEVTSK